MEELLGAIKTFAFGFAPKYWAFCDGQLLPIAQNQALYSLLGNTYGGDGRVSFALPDLRGRVVVHPGEGPGLTGVSWGQKAGTDHITLLTNNLPSHMHTLNGTAVVHTQIDTVSGGSPINETDGGTLGFGEGGSFPGMYSDGGTNSGSVGNISSTISGSTTTVGAGYPFGNRNPYLGIYTCICLAGIYPSRN